AESDVIEQVVDYPLDLALAARQLMEADGLGDDVTHLHARVHRGVRILEYHLHLAAQGATLTLALEGGEIDPLEEDLAGIGRIETRNRTGYGGLAGARLPHQTEGLPFEDLEADVVAGPHVLAAAREDGILGDKPQVHVLHPRQGPSVTARILTLTEPVSLEIDIGIRRTGILDIRDQREAHQLDV